MVSRALVCLRLHPCVATRSRIDKGAHTCTHTYRTMPAMLLYRPMLHDVSAELCLWHLPTRPCAPAPLNIQIGCACAMLTTLKAPLHRTDRLPVHLTRAQWRAHGKAQLRSFDSTNIGWALTCRHDDTGNSACTLASFFFEGLPARRAREAAGGIAQRERIGKRRE
jgi:hypothetical protein